MKAIRNRLDPRAGTLNSVHPLTLLGLCLLAPVPPAWAAPGDLDLAFAPLAAEVPTGPMLTVVGSDVYLYGIDVVHRYGPDGRLDPAWSSSVGVPSGTPYRVFTATPWGGWIVGGMVNVFLDHGAGAAPDPLVGGSGYVSGHPQDDGRVLIVNQMSGGAVYRARRDGQRDPVFAAHSALTGAHFDDGAGTVRIGGPWITGTVTADGRVVISGNFRRAGTVNRLGLARLRADGTVDPDWDPAPAAEITWTEADGLSKCPVGVASATEDAVVVVVQLKAVGGSPAYQLLRITATGKITLAVPLGSSRPDCPPVVQPDGRIFLGGSFTQWGTRPVTGLVRLEANGDLDESFAVTLGSGVGVATLWDMDLDDLGRLVVVGSFDTVNGVARPGVARLEAFTPPPSPAAASVSFSQPRVGTNDVLHLTAAVTGDPPPELQWYRDDQPLPGANHRGLRLEITDGRELGRFRLLVSNALGATNLVFPEVQLAEASPLPGTLDASWAIRLTNLALVTQLLPLTDGRLLVGGGAYLTTQAVDQPMLVRLHADGTPDPQFGTGGMVPGDGFVESFELLPNGHLLVVGAFQHCAGAPASGLVELDAAGVPVARAYPAFDPAHVSAVVPLSDGGLVVAGRFSRVGQITAYRLVRLTRTLEVDTTFHSPLADWQFVDDLALDLQGRLLIGGDRTYSDVPITNPPPLGLQRLLATGDPDPAFTAWPNGVRTIVVDWDGTLIVSPHPTRLADNGIVRHGFDTGSTFIGPLRPWAPDHTTVWNRHAGLVLPRRFSGPLGSYLVRSNPKGTFDPTFQASFLNEEIEAAAALSEGDLLLSLRFLGTPPPEGSRRLVRIAPDPDLHLTAPSVIAGQFQADLATQLDHRYEIRTRSSLPGTSEKVLDLEGDGYRQRVKVPAETPMRILELYRP